MLPAAILMGGIATRLRPVTESIPKALIDINGEPFVAHQLRLLESHGIRRVVLCIGYLGDMIRDFVADGSRFGIAVEYSYDGPVLRGTAGAIHQALPLLGEQFFVIYGDSYLPCDYAAIERAFLSSEKQGLMTVYRNQNQWDTSNVEFKDGHILAYDKRVRTPGMHHIDYGLGLFRNETFEALQAGANRDLAETYQDLLSRDQLAAFEITERFYEVGSFSGIEDLSNLLRAQKT